MKRKRLLSMLVLLAAVVTGAWAETIDLATLSASFITLNDGDVLTGTLDGTTKKCCLIIADGATVTLDNAIINGVTDGAPEATQSTVNWAGLNCIGDATIILKEGTTNSVRGFYHRCPGIFVPEGKTLTIEGPGTLNATGSISTEANHVDKSSNLITCSPGIGSAVSVPAGNIVINGGTINAQGGWASAGIGGNFMTACGNITINGGTVNATGSLSAAAIGGGWFSTSGYIEISGGTVTAISGPAINGTDGGPGIGCGSICNGGNITISGSATVTATGGDYAAGIGTGGTLNGFVSSCGYITIGGSTNVTTTGGVGAAGIGCGGAGSCGNITIGDNVIIKATKGDSAPYSVGAGSKVSDTSSTCGTITIGGVVISGNVSESPFNYPVYPVTISDGTEDAENWSATPSLAMEGQTVTITYAGTKSVKSVTAKRKITTGNIMVYFTDAQNYGDVHVYYWNDGPDWPGKPMTFVETNQYNQKIYRAEIPATAVGIIFNGNGSQTVDITENIADGSWWYATDQFDGFHHNEVVYNDKYTENIEVTNVDDNKWTFTMPDGNVELDIEYYPAYPVTISDGDVDATNWSATPTEQSAGQNVTLQYTGKKKIKRITIKAAQTARTAAEATAEDIGKLIGADGNIYDDAAAATAASTTAVAMIAYVGSGTEHATYTHGLAIALADESNSNWNMAKSTCEGKSAVTKAAWLLPSQNQWKAMFGANGGNEGSYSGLNTALANAGGTALQGSDGLYWTSTDSGYAYSHFMAYLNGGSVNFWEDDDNNSNRVRACLAF